MPIRKPKKKILAKPREKAAAAKKPGSARDIGTVKPPKYPGRRPSSPKKSGTEGGTGG